MQIYLVAASAFYYDMTIALRMWNTFKMHKILNLIASCKDIMLAFLLLDVKFQVKKEKRDERHAIQLFSDIVDFIFS